MAGRAHVARRGNCADHCRRDYASRRANRRHEIRRHPFRFSSVELAAFLICADSGTDGACSHHRSARCNESLLSAMVADGMIETRHDSNQELIGQGLANIVTPFFGGISATGAIARTATNIRSGGKTPVAGLVHSVTLLIIVLVAAPLAKLIPLAALSAVLFVVAYRMGEWDNFAELARGPKSDFFVLLLTFVLTVTFDLTIAVGVGLAMAGALFVKRMEEITQIRLVTPESELELGGDSIREKNVPEGVLVFRIEGP